MSYLKHDRVTVPVIDPSYVPSISLAEIMDRRFIMPRQCPVCRQTFFNRQSELDNHMATADDDHVVYGVLSS